jgi:MFS family permease
MASAEQMDARLDGRVLSPGGYSCRRLSVFIILANTWLFSSCIFADVFVAHKMDLHACACLMDGVLVNMSYGNVSSNSSSAGRAKVCASCADLGGALSCPPDYDPTTLESDFGLYCDSEWLSGLLSTFVFIGVAIGGYAGALSDKWGRRPVLLSSAALLLFAYPMSTTAHTYAAYASWQLLCGVGSSGMTQAGYTLATELAGPSKRTALTVELWSYNWALMSCAVPLVALALRSSSWRTLVLVLWSPQPLHFLAIFLVVPESPRWLQRQGRHDDAQVIMSRLGVGGSLLGGKPGQNSSVADGDGSHGPTDGARGGAAAARPAPGLTDALPGGRCGQLSILFSTRGSRWITSAEMGMWAVCALAYYGIAFSSADLSPSRELNFLLVSLPLIPCTYICARVMDHPSIGRRYANTLFLSTVGVCLTVATAVPSAAVGVSMVANFAANGAFNLIYVQVPELYPTKVRNSALGLCSASARASSMLSGLLPRVLGSHVTLGLIAVLCAAGAALAWFVIPETLGRGLPESLPDVHPACRRQPSNRSAARVDGVGVDVSNGVSRSVPAA